jgi:hypothetical protein
MKLLNVTNFDVAATFDQYTAGRHPEDGTPVIGEAYFVMITAPDGRRWAHERRWANTAIVRCDDADFGAYVKRDWEGEGRAAAEALAEAVIDRARVDLTHWVEVDPAYGSDAYQRQGIEAERAFADRFDA